jgi:hypothetical protein
MISFSGRSVFLTWKGGFLLLLFFSSKAHHFTLELVTYGYLTLWPPLHFVSSSATACLSSWTTESPSGY